MDAWDDRKLQKRTESGKEAKNVVWIMAEQQYPTRLWRREPC